MKVTKRQLRRIIKEEKAKILSEKNPDGTISDNEDNERYLLMAEVEEKLNEILDYIISESERIGGGVTTQYGFRVERRHVTIIVQRYDSDDTKENRSAIEN